MASAFSPLRRDRGEGIELHVPLNSALPCGAVDNVARDAAGPLIKSASRSSDKVVLETSRGASSASGATDSSGSSRRKTHRTCCRKCFCFRKWFVCTCCAFTWVFLVGFYLVEWSDCWSIPLYELDTRKPTAGRTTSADSVKYTLLGRAAASSRIKQRAVRKEIRVLSYNTFLRPNLLRDRATALENDFKEERMADMVGHFDDYDLLLLQETWTPGSNRRKSRLIGLAREKGFHYYARSACKFGAPCMDAMLLILSRYPLTDAGEHTYTTGAGVDYFASKGAVWTVLQPPVDVFGPNVAPVLVVTTHLQANFGGGRDEVREQQVEELGKLLRERMEALDRSPATQGAVALVTGDFNIQGRRGRADPNLSNDYVRLVQNLGLSGDQSGSSTGSAAWLGDGRAWNIQDVLTPTAMAYAKRKIAKGERITPGEETGVAMPVTGGYYRSGKSWLLTGMDFDDGLCLDYAFWIKRGVRSSVIAPTTAGHVAGVSAESADIANTVVGTFHGGASGVGGSRQSLQPIAGSAEVLDMKSVDGRPYKVLSDHHGLGLTLGLLGSQRPDSGAE